MFEYQLMTIKIKCDSSKPMMKNANLEKCGVFSSEFSNCFLSKQQLIRPPTGGFQKPSFDVGSQSDSISKHTPAWPWPPMALILIEEYHT
jgi:hypothetical protein